MQLESDLKSETNGLADFIDKYKPWIEKSNDLSNIHLVWLTHMDVFRSETVKSVIKVYEGIENYYKLNETQEIVEYINSDSALLPKSHVSRNFKDNDYTI